MFSGEQETQYWVEKNKFSSQAGSKSHQRSGSIMSVTILYDCMHILNRCWNSSCELYLWSVSWPEPLTRP
jgi:hypothetical protein